MSTDSKAASTTVGWHLLMTFCCLGDMALSAGEVECEGCAFHVVGVRRAWGKFNELMPILNNERDLLKGAYGE